MLEIAGGIILAFLIIVFWPVVVFLLVVCVALLILAALIGLGVTYPPLGWLPLIIICVFISLSYYEAHS